MPALECSAVGLSATSPRSFLAAGFSLLSLTRNAQLLIDWFRILIFDSTLWDTIVQFLVENRASIIVSLLIGALFFVLGPLGLWFSGKKVRREKILKAKSEFLDLTESILVNKEKTDTHKLLVLFRAVERQNGINLGLEADIENLLGDLALRFSMSKHLASDQKDAYIDQIDVLIKNLVEPEKGTVPTAATANRELPKSMRSIVSELRDVADKVNSDELKEKIDALEKYYRRSSDPISTMVRLMRERPVYRKIMIAYLVFVLIGTLAAAIHDLLF